MVVDCAGSALASFSDCAKSPGFFACGKDDTDNSEVVTDLKLDCAGFKDDDSDNELSRCNARSEIIVGFPRAVQIRRCRVGRRYKKEFLMKRFWCTFLAIVLAGTIVTTTSAQSGSAGEIGSYQSILSRAGYGDVGSGIAPAASVSPSVSSNTTGTYIVPAVPTGPVPVCSGPNCQYSNGVISNGTQGYSAVPQSTPVQSFLPQASVPSVPSVVTQSIPSQSGTVGGYAGSVEGGAVIDQGYVGNNPGSGTTSSILNYTEGTPTYSQPVISQPAISQPVISQPVISQPVISQPVYSAPVYSQPTYQTVPVYVAGQSFAPKRPKSNKVFSLFGVSLRRDYEDGVRLGYNADGSFFSDDVQHGNLTGIGAALTSRNAKGSGWEVRYWGLDESTRQNFGPGGTHLRGLDDVFYSANSASSFFDSADYLSVDRTTRINSLAFNLLRNGGRFKSCLGCGNYELLAGFRIFQFDEDLQFAANSASSPTRLEYALEAENLLTGFQVGGRHEVCIGSRLRLASGMNVGVFNNRVNSRQRIFDDSGIDSTISGQPFYFEDQKDDVAFLGEFNTGLIVPISNRFRLNAGYKIVGVAGVALAANQIPRDIQDQRALQTANSNGSLLLHGFYFGGEASF